MRHLFIILLTCLPLITVSATEDSTRVQPFFFGSVYSEANVGHHHDDKDPAKWDFPHVVLDAQLHFGKGWTLTGEFEYERFFVNSEWGNNFNDNYTTNLLNLSKQWANGLAVTAGILAVPVGVTNSGGQALTIYDPVSEASLLPMTWHEAGVSFSGSLGRLDFETQVLAYLDAPLKRSRMLGAAGRVSYPLCEGFTVGASGYWGNSYVGMISRSNFDYIDHRHIFTGSLDFNLDKDGFVADGSYIYANNHDAQSLGAEVGYDVLQPVGTSLSLIPFVRYDGVYKIEGELNRVTAGFNFHPLGWLVLKTEYSWTHTAHRLHRSLDACLGVQLEF